MENFKVLEYLLENLDISKNENDLVNIVLNIIYRGKKNKVEILEVFQHGAKYSKLDAEYYKIIKTLINKIAKKELDKQIHV